MVKNEARQVFKRRIFVIGFACLNFTTFFNPLLKKKIMLFFQHFAVTKKATHNPATLTMENKKAKK